MPLGTAVLVAAAVTATTALVGPAAATSAASPVAPTASSVAPAVASSSSGAVTPPVSALAKGAGTTMSWVNRGPTLRAASCSTALQCVGVGDGGAVLYTVNGGSTLRWSSVTPWPPSPPGTNPTLDAVVCTIHVCLALSGAQESNIPSHVYRSTDGGALWTDVGPLRPAPSGSQIATSIACDPGQTCVAVGPGGGVWRSANEGVSWEPLSAPSPKLPYSSVACPDVNTCLAVSLGPTAIRNC